MEKEKSAVDQFLSGLEDEGSSFGTEETLKDPFVKEETPAETVVEEKEEKPLPFNKDPKIQKFIEKEITKRLSEIKPNESKEEQQKENDEVVDALEAVIGNDTPEKRRAIKAFSDRLNEPLKKIADWENQQHQAELADKQAEEELENAFENIEETFDVDISSNNPTARKTRQEFVQFVEKIAPKDRNGEIVDYPDMTSAWETFSEIKKATATPSRAKELASRGITRSSEVQVTAPAKRLTFDNFDDVINGLGK